MVRYEPLKCDESCCVLPIAAEVVRLRDALDATLIPSEISRFRLPNLLSEISRFRLSNLLSEISRFRLSIY